VFSQLDLLDAYNVGYQRGYRDARMDWHSLVLRELEMCKDKLVKVYNEGDQDETDN
jgi:hypothetical protein